MRPRSVDREIPSDRETKRSGSTERKVKVLIYVAPDLDAAVRRHAFDAGLTLSETYARAALVLLGRSDAPYGEESDVGEPAKTPSDPDGIVSRAEFDRLAGRLVSLSKRLDGMVPVGGRSRVDRRAAQASTGLEQTKAAVAEELILAWLAEAPGWVLGSELDRHIEANGLKKSLSATAKTKLLQTGRACRRGVRWTLPNKIAAL